MTHIQIMLATFGGLTIWAAIIAACLAHAVYQFKAADRMGPRPMRPGERWWTPSTAEPRIAFDDGQVKETTDHNSPNNPTSGPANPPPFYPAGASATPGKALHS
jgi:hypothetical protein